MKPKYIQYAYFCKVHGSTSSPKLVESHKPTINLLLTSSENSMYGIKVREEVDGHAYQVPNVEVGLDIFVAVRALGIPDALNSGVEESSFHLVDTNVDTDKVVVELVGHHVEQRLEPRLPRFVRVALLFAWSPAAGVVAVWGADEEIRKSCTLARVIAIE